LMWFAGLAKESQVISLAMLIVLNNDKTLLS